MLRQGYLYNIIIFISFVTISCNSDIALDTSEFIIEEGYKIEIIASEPLLNSPVATVQDLTGRLWVVEMPGYMRDIDASDEDLNDGKIVILEDTNQDGKADNRKVIIDNLQNPRSICLVYGGIMYTDSTSLIWSALEGDEIKSTELVDDKYIIGGNIEHQPNGLLYNLDNWIYNAKSNARYKRQNGKWIKEATTFRGQWGITSDQSGRLIYNHNSAPILGDVTMPNVLIKNIYQKIEVGTGKYFTKDLNIYPIQNTAVNRGYEKDVLDSLGRVKKYTSACSPLVFHGNELNQDDKSDIFVCAPEGNLIAKYDLNYSTQSAQRNGKTEFLVSKEESFRPVHLMNGLDGALYITDLRKGIIQHTAYMSSYLREKILERGLDKITGKGRIYKVSKERKQAEEKSKQPSNVYDWKQLLANDNYSLRLEAQKEIINGYNNREISVSEINNATTQFRDDALVHLFYAADEIGVLTSKDLLNRYDYANQFLHVVALAPLWKKYDKPWVNETKLQFIDIYRSIISKKDETLAIQIAPNLAGTQKYWKDLIMMARSYPNNEVLIESIISGLEAEELFFNQIKKETQLTLLKEKLEIVINNKKSESNQSPKLFTAKIEDTRTNGLKTFQRQCASCHGIDGNGQKNIAPSLSDSKILTGPEEEIAITILHGYDSGSGVYQIKMPGYKNDPQMDNQKVAHLITYLLSTFAKKGGGISTEKIEKIRKE